MSSHRHHPVPIPHVWLLRLPALLALGISLFLIYQKSQGTINSIAGCGGEGGCSQVLGGRWSEWFGVPVTVLAAGMYICALLLTTPAVTRSNPRLAKKGLLVAGMLALLAACWFIGILIFAEKAFCPYCIATHICGIAFGILVLKYLWKSQRRQMIDNRKEGTVQKNGLAPLIVAAVLGIIALAVGQILGKGPDTHEIVGVGEEVSEPERTDPVPENAKTRSVSYASGQVTFVLPDSPHIGDIKTKHVITEFFDYTCRSCRQMHGDMHLLLEKHPDDFVLILTPCPLNSLCNPHFTGNSAEHTNSCEYAKLALALWRAAPEKFAEFHEFMMNGQLPPLADAKAKATALAGADALAAAESDPWIAERLKQTLEQYKILAASSPKMPKLLLGGTAILNGLARDPAQFVQALEQHFKLP